MNNIISIILAFTMMVISIVQLNELSNTSSPDSPLSHTALSETEQPNTVPSETKQPEMNANLSQAEQLISAYAKEHSLSLNDYPKDLIELLERNPETSTFVLEYPLKKDERPEIDLSEYAGCDTVPLFMQWDQRWGYMTYGDNVAGLTACGPVCLSMAAYYVTGDPEMSPDRIIQFAIDNGYCIPGNGTAWALISEGGEKLGLEVTELPLHKQTMINCLEDGWPIICIMGPGDFTTMGHFIVLTGVENGAFRVNDPNSYARSEQLWTYEQIEDQINNLWVIEPG